MFGPQAHEVRVLFGENNLNHLDLSRGKVGEKIVKLKLFAELIRRSTLFSVQL